jgi:PKHD-type hydroxylase
MTNSSVENSSNVKSVLWEYHSRIPHNICDILIEELSSREFGEFSHGQVGDTDFVLDKKYRNVLKKHIPGSHWVNGILYYFGMDANLYNFRFNTNMLEQIDFLKYGEGMFYKPHQDSTFNMDSPTAYRKLTIILQLSDETDYSGGEIVLYSGDFNQIKATKKKGSIIVFPSNTTHSVKTIKKGTRHSLVGWITGPPFA